MIRLAFFLITGALILVAEDSPTDLSAYRDLVTRAKAGDATVDYRQMRFVCLRLSSCHLRSTPDQLGKLASLGEPQARIVYTDTLLDEGFVNLEVHADQVATYQKLGDSPRAARSLAIASGLLSSIMKGRDGNTAETAYEVVVDREIYMVLAVRGLPQPILWT